VSRLKTDRKAQLGVGIAGLVAIVAAGWFLLIAPKREQAVSLDAEVATAQTALADKQAALAQPPAAVRVRASDLYRLTKALPDTNDMPEIILDVNRVAAQNHLSFRAVTPAAPVLGTGTIALPVTVSVQGRFASVSRFLGDLRRIVRVRNGLLDARGRTYSVTTVELGSPDDAKFPQVKATVTLNAYAFSAPPPASTTPPTTTPPSADGTVAAGATP
jgi:Tfp pilus assembly protein PilO